jgi:hypothetical protein
MREVDLAWHLGSGSIRSGLCRDKNKLRWSIFDGCLTDKLGRRRTHYDLQQPGGLLNHSSRPTGPDPNFLVGDNIPRYAILQRLGGWCREGKGRIRKHQSLYRTSRTGPPTMLWASTCCLDKSNNNKELSKAMISMFRWYRDATRNYTSVRYSIISPLNSDQPELS